MRRLVFRLTLLAGLLLAAIAAASQAERWALYPFDPRHQTPAQAGLPQISETRLTTPDDETLIVWTAPPHPGKPVILYFHGNSGNLASRAGRFRHFLSQGYGLVAPAYRGSSGSSGTPTEHSLISDATQVASHSDWPGWPAHPGPIIAYGESLGTAVTLGLLSNTDTPPDAIILEAPFTSIQALAEKHYPALAPYISYLKNQWPTLDRARTYLRQPLLILHGTQDELIPTDMGRAIHAAAPSPDKTLLIVPGAGHTDLWRSDTLPKLWRFLNAQ
ncbi:hypothetical protein SAMN06265173_11156 [Thalassovita litoralis]|jgi:hypothetical protein|uniref:Serine aminopeptidase S33 domain-containing protein n=1 Tax=Thalassovita litoralis TaxID=1010611 RepID=A0A521DKH6_9RHOB|nr:alpha/beta hydrolase [Thalassovita litoralis]SMO72128.1 hypothetical protein SAMN06265173_11156 [Thalassovita litoralis]